VSVVDAALAAIRDRALVCVVGPTASGKTALAVELCERLNGEVVSCDSVQIYRGFDIGSGKPSEGELARAPHHLIGVLDPLDPVDASVYARMADGAIEDVRARGKRPILCGGTFLWTKALLYGLAEAPSADPAIRERHRLLVEDKGRPALHALLASTDPETASRLHPNDVVRVSRALEVEELTGRPMSAWQAEHGFSQARHDAALLAIARPDLSQRIEARVGAMLAAGWIDEVKDLVAKGYAESRAMGSVGYREVLAHVRGELPDLAPAIVRSTRIFARRQKTWLNHAGVVWLTD
jgi:tRNA dimethylallyltransferase